MPLRVLFAVQFSGASASGGGGQSSSGPVEYERQKDEDVFGLDDFMQKAKKGGK